MTSDPGQPPFGPLDPRAIQSLSDLQACLGNILGHVDEIFVRNHVPYFLGYGSALGAIRHGGPIPWDGDLDLLIPISAYTLAIESLRRELPSQLQVLSPEDEQDYELTFSRVSTRRANHRFVHIDLFPMVPAPNRTAVRYLFDFTLHGLGLVFKAKRIDCGRAYKYSTKKRLLTRTVKFLTWPIPPSLVLQVHRSLAYLLRHRDTSHVYNSGGSYRMREYIPRHWLQGNVRSTFGALEVPVPSSIHEYLTHFYGDFRTPPPESVQANVYRRFAEIYLPELRIATSSVATEGVD